MGWSCRVRRAVQLVLLLALGMAYGQLRLHDIEESPLVKQGRWLRRQGQGFKMLALYEGHLLSGYGLLRDNGAVRWDALRLDRVLIEELDAVGQGKTLLARFEVLQAQYPDDPRVHWNLGYVHYEAKQFDRAGVAFERCLDLLANPWICELDWFARLCVEEGQIEKAIAFYERALRVEVTDQEVNYRSRLNQRVWSVGAYRHNLGISTLRTLGDLYVKVERWAEAETCFKEILASDGEYSKKHAKAKLAQIWQRLGKPNQLLTDLAAQSAQDPCDVDTGMDYAQALMWAGKNAQAIQQYQRIVALDSNNLGHRLRLAEAWEKDGQAEQALTEYATILFMGFKRPAHQFRRGKGGNPTAPGNVLWRLKRFKGQNKTNDQRLGIYQDLLLLLESPKAQWQARPSVLAHILKEMTAIYNADRQYEKSIGLWLKYRKQMKADARYAIQGLTERVDVSDATIQSIRDQLDSQQNDPWGGFILADLLVSRNQTDQAYARYSSLLAQSGDIEFINHLAHRLSALKQYALALRAYEKVEQLQPDKVSTHRLERRADLHMRLGDNEAAAGLYRKLLTHDATVLKYLRGLYRATNGREGGINNLALAGNNDLDKKREMARSLGRVQQDYRRAARLFEEIIAAAPTDLRSMAELAEVYERMGRRPEAIELYEKAWDLRAWESGRPWGTYIGLTQLYAKTGQDDKLLTLLMENGDTLEVEDYFRRKGAPERFEQYLLQQIEKSPSRKLQLHLGQHYLEQNNPQAARQVYEGLKQGLAHEPGSAYELLGIAQGFDSLGQAKKTLEVLQFVDYAKTSDRDDCLGKHLTSLYAKADQWDKVFDVCVLRLEKQEQPARVRAIAEQLAQLSLTHSAGPPLLYRLMERMENRMGTRLYRQFAGTIRSYKRAQIANPTRSLQTTHGILGPASDTHDPLMMLMSGHQVQVPQDCRILVDFLEKLAFRADTVAVHSFAQHPDAMKAPRLSMKDGPAFEVLATALNGTGIGFEVSPKGQWLFGEPGRSFQKADGARTVSYDAQGGLLGRATGAYRHAQRRIISPSIWLKFMPALKQHIIAAQYYMTVTEAIDDMGREVPFRNLGDYRWIFPHQVHAVLGLQDPPARAIAKLRGTVKLAVATKWASFYIESLAHRKPIRLKHGDVTVTIDPVRQTTRKGNSCWSIDIDLQNGLDANYHCDGMRLFTPEGVEISRSRTNTGDGKIRLCPTVASCQPSQMNLSIQEPQDVKVIPVELTFTNITIRDQPPVPDGHERRPRPPGPLIVQP